MAADGKAGTAPFLEPDAKSQVTLRYANERPVEATAIVVSTQHAPGYFFHKDEGDEAKYTELRKYVLGVIADVLPAELLTANRSEEHTSELQSLMRISYAVFCLKKKKYNKIKQT